MQTKPLQPAALYTGAVLATLCLSMALAASPAFAQAPVKAAAGVLTDNAGMTLYVFDKDTAGSGKSVCNGPCAGLWPALKADDSAKPAGDYSIVVRDDGAKQWAFKGKPLYLWVKDQKPGDKTGDNVGNIWHMVAQ